MLLIKVSSKSQLLLTFLIFMKFTCVISWVIISMVCSSCILSSRVGRFKCRSWRVASSFTKKYERKMKYVITSQQLIIFIISEWFWHIIQSQRHYLRLFTMIFCPVWYAAVNKNSLFCLILDISNWTSSTPSTLQHKGKKCKTKNKINNQSNIHIFLTIICQVFTFLSLGREETKSLSLGFTIKISGISYLPFWGKPGGLGAGGAVLEINMTTGHQSHPVICQLKSLSSFNNINFRNKLGINHKRLIYQ